MIEEAKLENHSPKIDDIHLSMEDLATLNQKFDIVVSSLAFHYVEAYPKLIKDIYHLLTDGGYLLFSQEHPLVTSHSQRERWTKNDNGMKLYANISNYGREGGARCCLVC